ncbi:MAG: hypothetical protein WCK37_01720 [Candidatus Falkowbacteria bacterium]
MFKKLLKSFAFWKYLTNFWTISYFVFIVIDFLLNNEWEQYLDILGFIYIGVLAIYVGNKEFERWYHKHLAKHPGETFVLVWTALIFILLLATIITKKPYKIPSVVISSYVAVLTILAITEKSKSLFRNKNK